MGGDDVRVPVAFGQYVPVDSPVHALDAKTKMGLVAAFTISLFLIDGLSGMAAAAALVVVAVSLSKVPWRIALRGIRAVVMILMITLAVHALRWNPATLSLVRVGPLAVDAAGLTEGVFFVVRIVLLVVGTSLLTLTTSPVALTDGLERVMRPLEALRFPAAEVAMMLTIALRFIPTTAQEAEKLIVAQTARFDAGGPLKRARAYVPVLVPLFVNLFRRADDLATAMEARCYRGGEGRTRLHESKMQRRDWAVLCLGTLVLVSVGIVF
jgi:energy-coupling factor transport system permease protein